MLDAPQLQDDFYLNLVDWSSLNVLAVGLGACVYLWSACTSKVREGHIHSCLRVSDVLVSIPICDVGMYAPRRLFDSYVVESRFAVSLVACSPLLF